MICNREQISILNMQVYFRCKRFMEYYMSEQDSLASQ